MDVLLLNTDGSPLSLWPLSVINWQRAVKLVYLDKLTVLEYYDDWELHSPSCTLSVPSIVMVKGFVRNNKTVKYSRNNIYLRDDFQCKLQITNSCRKASGRGHTRDNLSIDHVIPRDRGGPTTWDNVVTACRQCNTAKSNKDVPVLTIPKKPSYYELAKNRKKAPIFVKDIKWLSYLDWNEDKVHLVKNGKIHNLMDQQHTEK